MPLPHTHHLAPAQPCCGCLSEAEAHDAAKGIVHYRSWPNPDRPFRRPGEQDHYRSDLEPGAIVRTRSWEIARLICWGNQESHPTGGRMAYLEPLVAHPDTELDQADRRRPCGGAVVLTDWEDDLTPARPGDVGQHLLYPVDRPRHVGPSWT